MDEFLTRAFISNDKDDNNEENDKASTSNNNTEEHTRNENTQQPPTEPMELSITEQEYADKGYSKLCLYLLSIGQTTSEGLDLIDIDDEPWKSIKRKEIKPQAKHFSAEILRRAKLNCTDKKFMPRPANWNSEQQTKWLKDQPIVGESDCKFIRYEVDRVRKILEQQHNVTSTVTGDQVDDEDDIIAVHTCANTSDTRNNDSAKASMSAKVGKVDIQNIVGVDAFHELARSIHFHSKVESKIANDSIAAEDRRQIRKRMYDLEDEARKIRFKKMEMGRMADRDFIAFLDEEENKINGQISRLEGKVVELTMNMSKK